MDEETIDIPLTTEVRFEAEGMRRISMGNYDIQISETKALPHYLTVSAGSCHDFCKYGNDSETKMRSLVPKKFTTIPDKTQHQIRSANSVLRKTKSEITPKAPPDLTSQTPNKCEVIFKEGPTSAKKVVVSSKQVSLPGEGMHAKHANDLKPKPLQRAVSALPSSRQLSRRYSEIIIPKTLEALGTSSIGDPRSRRNKDMKTRNGMGISKMGNKSCFVRETVSPSPRASMKGVRSTKAASLLLASRQLSRRHSEIILPKDLEAPQMNPIRGSSYRRNNEIKTSKDIENSKISSLGRSSSGRNSEFNTNKEKEFSKLSMLGRSRSRRNSEMKTGTEMETSKMSSLGSPSRENNKTKTSSVSKMSHKSGLVPQTFAPSPNTFIAGMLRTKSENKMDPKEMYSIKKQNSVRRKKTKQPSDEKLPEKTLYVIESTADNKTIGLVKNGILTNNSPPSADDKGLLYGQHGVQASSWSPSSNNYLNFNRNKNITLLSSSSSLTSEGTDVRDTGNGTHSTPSSPSASMSSSPTLLLTGSMHSDESGIISERDGAETDNQMVPRSVGRVVSEDGNSSPLRLKFKRGKVVNIQYEGITPRRLKFRQGKVLGENEIGNAVNNDSSGRIFLRRSLSDGGINGSKTESVKNFLRHQELEGRKGTQCLFNNVIEETASKLVQSRKSKVKALVGAFETIIHLESN